MNVRDLIDELSKYPPHMPVRVTLMEIYGGYDDSGEFRDDMVIPLGKEEAIEADRVSHEGNHVLILSR